MVVADAPQLLDLRHPYYISGRSPTGATSPTATADLEATGMTLRLDTTARRIDAAATNSWSPAPEAWELLAYAS